MKFKSQDKQNQLIENITVNHLVVGVDIAQEAHVARAVNFRGVALGNPLEFSNDEEGFKSLDRWIRDLLASYKLSKSSLVWNRLAITGSALPVGSRTKYRSRTC